MKAHFLSLGHRDVALSNGWEAKLRELSGAEKLRLDSLMMEVTYTKGKAAVTPRFDKQADVYCQAISASLVELRDGDNKVDGLTPEEAGQLPQSVFNELREAVDQLNGGGEGN